MADPRSLAQKKQHTPQPMRTGSLPKRGSPAKVYTSSLFCQVGFMKDQRHLMSVMTQTPFDFAKWNTALSLRLFILAPFGVYS